jgi:predicted site-specific integrase-resolvase
MKTEVLMAPWEVDRLFRFERGSAKKLASQGDLPHVVLPGGEIRFVREEIDQFLRDAHRPRQAPPQ